MSTNKKQQKYDRQLRLWDNHGQDALEAARVCVINAGALGCEILKNLILPGIGSFTIVDGATVTDSDLGNNFFLLPSQIGTSRAASAVSLLVELNEEVRGDFIAEDVASVLASNPEFFSKFTCVITTNTDEGTVKQLADVLWEQRVPLLSARVYGMIAMMRLVAKEHTVIETHPDNSHPDLRTLEPFPALAEHAAKLNMAELDLKQHSHVPYSLVLLKELERWRAAHDGQAPANYKEKRAFKEFMKEGVRRTESGLPEDELNYEEAVSAVNVTLIADGIPRAIRAVMDDPLCENLTPETPKFWFLARALRDFVAQNHSLPLRGSIPDMTADSDSYVTLQKIYQAKAGEDRAAITERVQELLASVGLPADRITAFDIKLFCRNTAFLHVLRTRSFAEELDPETNKASVLEPLLEDPDNDLAVLYVLLRAADAFKAAHSHYPGEHQAQLEEDAIQLKDVTARVVAEMGMSISIKEDYIQEMCRYGAAELHTVAALLGGAAAHEVIKLVTAQYVPFNNTFILNAVSNGSCTLEL